MGGGLCLLLLLRGRMATRHKVISVETDGVENEYQTEVPLDADRVYFDNTGTTFAATDVRSAIIEAQTGSVSGDNFSYNKIHNRVVTIPERQQMLVHEKLEITGTGELLITGELVLFTER